jgi:hypothetical protein
MATLGLLLLFAFASISMALNPIVPFEIDTKDPNLCEQCKDAVGKVKKILEDPATEKKVLDTVNRFCNFLIAPPIKQKCKDMATKAFRDARETLKNPAKVCRDLKVCKDDSQSTGDNAGLRQFLEAMSLELIEVVNEPVPFDELDPQMKSAFVCKACKAAVGAIGYELQNPVFQQTIIKIISTACKSVLPGALNQACDTLIADFVRQSINFLAEVFRNPEACVKVHLC